jgi:hypothetical protein
MPSFRSKQKCFLPGLSAMILSRQHVYKQRAHADRSARPGSGRLIRSSPCVTPTSVFKVALTVVEEAKDLLARSRSPVSDGLLQAGIAYHGSRKVDSICLSRLVVQSLHKSVAFSGQVATLSKIPHSSQRFSWASLLFCEARP